MSLLEIPWRPATATLRWFGLLCFAAAGAAAATAWRRGDAGLGAALAGAGVVIACLGLAAPAALRPLFVGSIVVTYPGGWLLSHVIVAALYCCLFAPLGLFFRLVGRDALSLRLDPRRNSYWETKPAAGGVDRYFYQS